MPFNFNKKSRKIIVDGQVYQNYEGIFAKVENHVGLIKEYLSNLKHSKIYEKRIIYGFINHQLENGSLIIIAENCEQIIVETESKIQPIYTQDGKIGSLFRDKTLVRDCDVNVACELPTLKSVTFGIDKGYTYTTSYINPLKFGPLLGSEDIFNREIINAFFTISHIKIDHDSLLTAYKQDYIKFDVDLAQLSQFQNKELEIANQFRELPQAFDKHPYARAWAYFYFLEENEKVTRQLFPNLDNFFKLTISQNLNVQDFMKEIRDDAAEKTKIVSFQEAAKNNNNDNNRGNQPASITPLFPSLSDVKLNIDDIHAKDNEAKVVPFQETAQNNNNRKISINEGLDWVKKYGPNNEYSLIHAIYTFENKSYIKAVYVDGHWEIIPAHMVGWVLDRVGVTKQARLEILSHISKFKRSYSENPKALQDQIQTVLKTLENQAISDKELSFMFDHFSNQADFFLRFRPDTDKYSEEGLPEKTADGGVLSEYYAFEPREEFLANMERNPIRTEQATVGVHVRSESAHVFNTRLLRKENYFTLEFEPKIIEEIKNKAHREAAKAGKDYTKKYDAVYKAELEAYLKKDDAKVRWARWPEYSLSIKNIADPGLVLGLDTEQFYHDASGDPKICTADLLQRLMLVLDSANELNVIRSKQASVVEQNNLINREGNNNIKQYKYINCQITGNPEQVPAIFPIAQSYQYRLLLKGNLPPEMIIHDFGTSFRKYETCGVIHYNESYVSAIVTSRAIERLAEFATRRAEVDRPEEFYIQAKKYFETLADATRKYNTYLATLDKNPVKPANYRSAVALVSLLHDGKKIIYLQVGSYNDEYIASDVVRELTSNMVHELTHALTKEGNPFVKLGKVSYENLLRFNEKYEERLRLGSRLVSDIEDFVLKHYKDDKKIVERLAYAMKAFFEDTKFLKMHEPEIYEALLAISPEVYQEPPVIRDTFLTNMEKPGKAVENLQKFGIDKEPGLYQYSGPKEKSGEFPIEVSLVSVSEIKSLKNSDPRTYQFVILSDGELIIAEEYSEKIKIKPDRAAEIKQFHDYKGVSILINNRVIDFDRKGEPIWEQVPVSHAEIVGFRPVVALGNFYVVNGKIAYKHPSGRWGIDHYSDYNCNRKEQQKVIKHVFKKHGLEVEEAFFRDFLSEKRKYQEQWSYQTPEARKVENHEPPILEKKYFSSQPDIKNENDDAEFTEQTAPYTPNLFNAYTVKPDTVAATSFFCEDQGFLYNVFCVDTSKLSSAASLKTLITEIKKYPGLITEVPVSQIDLQRFNKEYFESVFRRNPVFANLYASYSPYARYAMALQGYVQYPKEWQESVPEICEGLNKIHPQLEKFIAFPTPRPAPQKKSQISNEEVAHTSNTLPVKTTREKIDKPNTQKRLGYTDFEIIDKPNPQRTIGYNEPIEIIPEELKPRYRIVRAVPATSKLINTGIGLLGAGVNLKMGIDVAKRHYNEDPNKNISEAVVVGGAFVGIVHSMFKPLFKLVGKSGGLAISGIGLVAMLSPDDLLKRYEKVWKEEAPKFFNDPKNKNNPYAYRAFVAKYPFAHHANVEIGLVQEVMKKIGNLAYEMAKPVATFFAESPIGKRAEAVIQECMAAVKECKKNYQAACEEYGLVVPEGASLILQDSYLQACVQKNIVDKFIDFFRKNPKADTVKNQSSNHHHNGALKADGNARNVTCDLEKISNDIKELDDALDSVDQEVQQRTRENRQQLLHAGRGTFNTIANLAWKIYLVKKNEKEFENKKDEIKQNVIDQLKKRGLYQLIEDVEPYLARNYENYQALHHDMYNGLHAGMLTKIKEFRSQLAEFDKQIAGLRDDREKLHNNRGELEQYQLKLIEMLNKFEFNSFLSRASAILETVTVLMPDGTIAKCLAQTASLAVKIFESKNQMAQQKQVNKVNEEITSTATLIQLHDVHIGNIERQLRTLEAVKSEQEQFLVANPFYVSAEIFKDRLTKSIADKTQEIQRMQQAKKDLEGRLKFNETRKNQLENEIATKKRQLEKAKKKRKKKQSAEPSKKEKKLKQEIAKSSKELAEVTADNITATNAVEAYGSEIKKNQSAIEKSESELVREEALKKSGLDFIRRWIEKERDAAEKEDQAFMALPPDKKAEKENARHIAAGIRNADDYIIRKIQEDYFVIRQTLAATGYATGAIERFFCDMQAAPKIAEFCKNNNIKLAELSKASHHLQMGTSAISVIFNIYEKCVEIGDKLKVYHGPSENETSVENGNQKGFYQNIIYALSNAETRKAFLASLLPSSIGTVGLVFTLLNVVSHWIAPPSGTMEAVVKGIEDLREFSKLILEKLQTVANDNMNNILREQAKNVKQIKELIDTHCHELKHQNRLILSAISDMDAKQEAGQISDHLARINQEIVVINHQAEKLVYKLERYLKSSKNKNFTGLNYIDSFNGKLRCNNFNPWHFMGVISRKMGYESEQELANFEVLSAIVSEVLSSLSKDNQWVIDLINQNKLQGIFQALIDELQAIQEFIAFGQSRLLILANSVVLAYEGINYAIKKVKQRFNAENTKISAQDYRQELLDIALEQYDVSKIDFQPVQRYQWVERLIDSAEELSKTGLDGNVYLDENNTIKTLGIGFWNKIINTKWRNPHKVGEKIDQMIRNVYDTPISMVAPDNKTLYVKLNTPAGQVTACLDSAEMDFVKSHWQEDKPDQNKQQNAYNQPIVDLYNKYYDQLKSKKNRKDTEHAKDDVLLTSIHANSIPLIFPRNLLASLELDMPILDVFYKAEALNLGAVITNYSFEKNKEGLYELSIVFSYHDCLGKAIGCYRSVVASFNAFTVEAYLKKDLNNGNDVNFDEFLLLAMYGSPDSPLGLGLLSRPSQLEKTLKIPLVPDEIRFMGLYQIFSATSNAFIYDPDKCKDLDTALAYLDILLKKGPKTLNSVLNFSEKLSGLKCGVTGSLASLFLKYIFEATQEQQEAMIHEFKLVLKCLDESVPEGFFDKIIHSVKKENSQKDIEKAIENFDVATKQKLKLLLSVVTDIGSLFKERGFKIEPMANLEEHGAVVKKIVDLCQQNLLTSIRASAQVKKAINNLYEKYGLLMATIQLISGLDYTSIQGRLQELGIIEPYSVDFFASENIGGLSISNENMETFKTEMLENPGQWLISLQELLKILTEWRQFNPTNNINPGTWKISENLLEYGYKAPGISSDNLMQEQAPIQDQSKKKAQAPKNTGTPYNEGSRTEVAALNAQMRIPRKNQLKETEKGLSMSNPREYKTAFDKNFLKLRLLHQEYSNLHVLTSDRFFGKSICKNLNNISRILKEIDENKINKKEGLAKIIQAAEKLGNGNLIYVAAQKCYQLMFDYIESELHELRTESINNAT